MHVQRIGYTSDIQRRLDHRLGDGRMQTHIARWGNSLALRIPRAVADQLRLGAGGAVELSVEEDRLVVRAARRRVRLDELLERITPDNLPESFDDRAQGEEAL